MRPFVYIVKDGTDPEDPEVPSDKVVTKTDGEENDGKKYHVGDTVTWQVWVKNIYDEEKTLTVTEAEGMTITEPTELPKTLQAGEELTITVTHVVTAADVEAGKITNNVTVKLGDLEKPGDDTIETEPIEITITADSDSKVYDATPLTKDSWKQTAGELAQGDEITSVTVTGSQTLVGSSDNVPSDAVIENAAGEDVTKGYKITYVNGTLEVTPLAVTVTITGSRESKPYNGEEQKTEGYEVEISDPVYTEADFTGPDEAVAKGKNVGAYEMGLKEEQFTNINDNFDVTFSVMDGELKITAVSLTVTAASDSKVYDGTPLTAPTATAAPLQGSDRLGSVTVTGTITDVGTVPNVPSDAMIVNADGADVSGNYIITYVNGTLTINPVREYTITVRGNSATRTYNGAAQSVSGYTFSAFDESITITRQLAQDDPKATASGTGVGTYRMTMSAADFEATSDKYDVIRFVVIPGTLRITAVPDDDDEEIIDPDVPLAAPATGLGSQVGECFE